MTDDIKAQVRRFYSDVLNTGELGLLADIATEDYLEHDPLPGQGSGLAGLTERVTMLREGLAGTYTVEDVIAEGDRVAVRWTETGTHRGEIAGMPPTGNRFTISGIDIYRASDGKLAEHWHVIDMLSLLQQLGFVPSP